MAACRGKTVRQIEELVAERDAGDAPTSDPNPDLRARPMMMLLRPAEEALLRKRNLGLTRAEAAALVERAVARVGDADVEPLLRAALREYPSSSG